MTLKRCFTFLGKTLNKYNCLTVKQNTFCFLHQYFPLFSFHFSCTIWLQLIYVLLQQMRTGYIKERRSSGSNAKKQHNGVNSIGINRDNVVFTNRGTNDQRYRWKIGLVCVWRQKRPSLHGHVFRYLRLLLIGASSHVQSIRYYSHRKIFINVPFKQLMTVSLGGHNHASLMINQGYVAATVNRKSYLATLMLLRTDCRNVA